MKRCPKCGISHDDSVWTCDCGYDFFGVSRREETGGIGGNIARGKQSTSISGTYSGACNRNVIIQDFDIPFGRLVAFMVKCSLAAIPAAIIVSILVSILWAIFGIMLFSLV